MSFHDFTEAEIGMEPRKESSLSFVCSTGCSYTWRRCQGVLEATSNKGKMDREASLCWVWWCSCNPSTGKQEVGGSEIEGQPQLHSRFEASLGYVRLFQGEKEQYFIGRGFCMKVIFFGGGVVYMLGKRSLWASSPGLLVILVSLCHMGFGTL